MASNANRLLGVACLSLGAAVLIRMRSKHSRLGADKPWYSQPHIDPYQEPYNDLLIAYQRNPRKTIEYVDSFEKFLIDMIAKTKQFKKTPMTDFIRERSEHTLKMIDKFRYHLARRGEREELVTQPEPSLAPSW